MTFYDSASLVFLPSGGAGKDGKAYSIKPTDGSGDFTFSRGSNLTATRVDSNGLIEKGRENLLLQSNQFDTTWATSNASVTSGQSGYDGTNDAWLLNSSGASPRIQQIVSSSGVSTFSVYAKAATDSFIQFRTFMTPSGDASIWVNLSLGTITNTSGSFLVGSNITSVGNGWYRCSLTFNGSLSYLRMYPASAFGVYSTSGNGVYIQDAQLEIGLVATEYIESGATTGLAGLLENEPRFDYSGGASCPSLLLEPSRTNLVTQSEYTLGSNWLGSQTSITPVLSPDLSPEGKLNAYRITRTSSNTQLGSLSTVTSGQTYTGSIYIKRVSGSYNARIKVVENTSTTIAITDEWERFDLTAVATSSNGRLYISPFSTGDVIDVWGAQLEQGSYVTSYIPNHSGGSVTRGADVCTNSTGGVSQTEGTIFIDYKDSPNKDVLFACSTSSGLITNNIRLSYNQLYIRNSTGNLVVGSVTLPDAGKLAIKYDTNGVKIFSNGNSTPIFTNSTSISFDGTVNFVRIGSKVNNTGIQEFNVDQFLIFTTALSDANCVTLTS